MKTPEERGPLGAWAYDSRDRLGLSPEQVVLMLGKYDTSTIRKAEGNSEHMSRPLWRLLTELYPRLATERKTTLDAMPSFGEPEPMSGELADLIRGIGDLVRQVEAERAERRRWELGWIATLRAALTGQVPAELLDALVPLPPEGTQP